MLKSSGRVHKSEGHDAPFEGAVEGVESSFPFIALSDSDQMVGVPEVNFQIDFGLARAVKEVSNVR